MSEINYVVPNGCILWITPPDDFVDMSGTFTFDAATSTESKVNLFLNPRNQDSGIVKGFYSQLSPIKAPSASSLTAAAAGVQPMCTLEFNWGVTGPVLTLLSFTYNNGATGKQITGRATGTVVVAT